MAGDHGPGAANPPCGPEGPAGARTPPPGDRGAALGRRRIRVAVRSARNARGLTQQEAAAELDWSLSKLARIENGQVRVTLTDLRALLDLYQVSPEEAVALEQMARAARQPPGSPGTPRR
jgi:ribosome-binding protein aMBF1 (putative translation factor)